MRTDVRERLALVYRTEAPKLWRTLVGAFGDREVASDALQEAFAQAAARGEGLRSPERWVWTAAFRIAAGEMKERNFRDRSGEPADPPDGDADASELLERLAALPTRQRAALVLHYYSGYKAREIAQFMGCSAATVRVHLSKGRKRLRTLLEAGDE